MSTDSPSVELVPFQDDQIEAIRGADGKDYIVPKRICENLEIAWSPQYVKLSRDHRSSITTIVTVDASGRERKICVMPVDAVPWWLTSIDARKVAPGKRAKLETYQLRAAKVLFNYFSGAAQDTLPRPALRVHEPDGIPSDSPTAIMGRMAAMSQAVYADMLAKDRMIKELQAQHSVVQSQVGEVLANQALMAEQFEQLAQPIFDARRELKALPVSEIPAKPLTTRMKINARHQIWCKANGVDYQEKWHQVYDQFRRRYSIDVVARKKHDPEKYPTYLDVVQDLGKLDDLFALVCYLCPDQSKTG